MHICSFYVFSPHTSFCVGMHRHLSSSQKQHVHLICFCTHLAVYPSCASAHPRAHPWKQRSYSLMHFDSHAVSMVITGVARLTIPERLIQEVKVRINPCGYTQNENYLFNNTFCSYCLLLLLALNTSTHQLECFSETAKV